MNAIKHRVIAGKKKLREYIKVKKTDDIRRKQSKKVPTFNARINGAVDED